MSVYKSKLIIRITVLGSKDTGKSTLLRIYIEEGCNEKLLSCSEKSYSKEVNLDGARVIQQILDSDGKNSAVLSWSHGALIIFSVDDRDSFTQAEDLIKKTSKLTMRNVRIMLIANKVDIKNRQVSLEEGQKLAMKYRCSYAEVSAENDKDGVTSIFHKLSKEVLDAQGLRNDRSPLRIRRFFSVFNPRMIKQRRRMSNF